MKKMMLAAMAAMVIGSTGTALAATPDRGFSGDNATCYEVSYAHCGGGYYGGGRGGRGGYGCGGGYGDGYCWGNESNNEG